VILLNAIDIIIIGIIIFGLLLGVLRGFLISLFSFISYIVAFICAKIYSPRLADYLADNTSILHKVNNFVAERLNSLSLPTLSIPTSDISIPNGIDSTLLKTTEYTEIMKKFPFLENLIKQNLIKTGQTLAEILVQLLFIGICAVLIFFIVKILFSIVGAIIKSLLKKSSILNSTDKLLGMLFGGLTSLIIIILLIMIITPIVFTSPNSDMAQLFSNSLILNYIYSSSLYTYIVNNGLSILFN
jgi:uncharacterized membrane protein required for colicin V production